MKRIRDFSGFLNETYTDASGKETQFKGGEKVKKYFYEDKRDTGKPGEVTYGIVKRVESDQNGNSVVIIEYTSTDGKKSVGKIPLNNFNNSHEIVK